MKRIEKNFRYPTYLNTSRAWLVSWGDFRGVKYLLGCLVALNTTGPSLEGLFFSNSVPFETVAVEYLKEGYGRVMDNGWIWCVLC